MGKKLLSTPRSKVRAALRQLWLRSRERSAALKREGNCCQECGVKQSVAKGREVRLEVHHIDGINNWDEIIDKIYETILCDPKHLKVYCKDCHEEHHKGGKCS